MPIAAAPKTFCVALIGNPNTGKSTLFNALAGVRQQVGNYPGVTVEKKVGHMDHRNRRFALVDLPGTYSLAPRSPDEMVAVDVLLGRREGESRPNAVACIVDASNLERNLYLVSQVLELGLPTVIALNMIDVAERRGMHIDCPRLERQLGVPVVALQANRGIGIDRLKDALSQAAEQITTAPESPFPPAFVQEVTALRTALNGKSGRGSNSSAEHDDMPRYLAERLLLDSSGYLEQYALPADRPELKQQLRTARERLSSAGCPIPAIEAISRYAWVGRTLEGVVTRPQEPPRTVSDKLDRLLTHRFWGSLLFALMMFVVFQSVFSWAEPLMRVIDAGMGTLQDWISGTMAAGALRSLLVDGIIGGVGGVLIFLPQIMILFFFIAVLEDCGYMARAAYLMDKLMVHVGLSGKSFIPLLSSFACAIPGVMATRVIENKRDRLTTILIAPLMSCSARLPVYTLLIKAFIPNRGYAGGVVGLQALVMMGMYLVGMLVAVGVALILKRTILRGPTPPFVLELPGYKVPSIKTVCYRMLDRGWAFVQRAGTLIVAVSIVVWASLYYPRDVATVEAPFAAHRAALEQQLSHLKPNDPQFAQASQDLSDVEHQILGAYRRQSFMGRLGHWIEPVVRPLGWDWRIGCAALASFPAREVVVATLGILYNLGEDVDLDREEDMNRLQSTLRAATWDGTNETVFNIPVALSIMVFFALCAQCASTLVVIKRETNSWGWPLFTFAYMTGIAYLGALATYQIGMLFG
jgi:ferrous iron transport protein B